MEGFPTPHYGYFSKDYYTRIVKAFQAIGDVKDAKIINEAGNIDSYYQTLLDNADNEDERSKIYNEFSEKLDKLEQDLYLNTDSNMWELLYSYLEKQISES